MSTVSLSGVTKRFEPSTVAVDDLTLDIADGEFLVLLGPSGCGKSTALRLIAGLEAPDTGTISIDGRVVDDVDAKDRDIAMVFQSYALYPHLSVRRNIGFPLKPRGVARKARDRAAEDVAVLLGLTDVLDRKPRQLSGGQQQRVALARALVREPSVFLMDEPLSNLDAQLRTETRAEITQLQRGMRTTTVYVTHDQVEALTMADRIAVIGEGRLQQLGTPEEVYGRPVNVFVAGFVGAPRMNLWPCAVAMDGSVRLDGIEIVGAGSTPRLGREQVTVGIRPDAVRCAEPGAPQRGVPATVSWVEDLGHEHVIGGRLDRGDAWCARWYGSGATPALTERVRLSVDPTQIHWFDTATGERVACE